MKKKPPMPGDPGSARKSKPKPLGKNPRPSNAVSKVVGKSKNYKGK